MKSNVLFVRLPIIIFLFSCNACAHSENRSIPTNKLSKSISELKDDYLGFEEIEYPINQDSDITMKAWRFTGSDGHSFIVLDENRDGISDAIVVTDSHYRTSDGVGVGDKLSEVMKAHSDAQFYGSFDLPELIKVYANNKSIEFIFDSSGVDLEKLIKGGEVSMDSKDIANAPVWKIYLREPGKDSQ